MAVVFVTIQTKYPRRVNCLGDEVFLLDAEYLRQDISNISRFFLFFVEHFEYLVICVQVAACLPIETVAATHAVEVSKTQNSFQFGTFLVRLHQFLGLWVEDTQTGDCRVEHVVRGAFAEGVRHFGSRQRGHYFAAVQLDLVAVDVEETYQQSSRVVEFLRYVYFGDFQLVPHALEQRNNHQDQRVRPQGAV